MLSSGRATVVAAGTKVPLLAATVDHAIRLASWITVVGDISNTGTVYVGDSTVKNASGGAKTYVGHPIVKPAAGAQPNFINIREVGGPTIYDLATIYIDSDTSGDTVTFNYGRR
jgi:hypothetical protein